MLILYITTLWELFFDGFDVEHWPGIIFSFWNGVSICFFSGKSCGRVIICNRLLGEWKISYMIDGFVGRWVLNQKCMDVDTLDIFFRGMNHNPSSVWYPLSTAFSDMMILVVFT